jgi:hypothetical protein
MQPVKIFDHDAVLSAPKDWDAAKYGACGDLYVRRENDGSVFASAWSPTPEELMLLNLGAPVILRIAGGQPPVSLKVEMDVAAARQAIIPADARLSAMISIEGALSQEEIFALRAELEHYVRPALGALFAGWSRDTGPQLEARLRRVGDYVAAHGGARLPAEVRTINSMRYDLAQLRSGEPE